MQDKYLDMIYEQYDDILMMYKMHEKHRPIIEYSVQEEKIHSYPYEEYRNNLSPSSQGAVKEQYENALGNDGFVVFVRDTKRKKLRSYTLDIN